MPANAANEGPSHFREFANARVIPARSSAHTGSAGKEVAEYVRIREDRAEHERPGEDPAAVHRMRGKHVLAAEDGFSDQRASDAMSDRIHCSSLSDALPTRRFSGRISAALFW